MKNFIKLYNYQLNIQYAQLAKLGEICSKNKNFIENYKSLNNKNTNKEDNIKNSKKNKKKITTTTI